MKISHALVAFALVAARSWGMDLLGVEANQDQGVPATPVATAAATQPLDAATARAAFDAFLAKYYVADTGTIRKIEDRPQPRPQPHNPWQWVVDKADRAKDWVVGEAKDAVHLYKADYWWVPHFIHTAADSYELTGDARDRDLAKRLNDSLFSPYYYWLFNSFNDDLGWHMLSCLRMHEVTKDGQWLADGKKLYARIREYLDGTWGGGVWWKRDGTKFKNTPINGPFVIGALQLFRATGDAQYQRDAHDVYAWMEKTLFASPRVFDGLDQNGLQKKDYTYNYGTFVGASLAMYDDTHDARYLANATAAADWAIANLSPGGIVKDEGSGDGAGFKMVFTRYLLDLATRPGGEKYVAFLDQNAQAAWTHRRPSDSIMGYDWGQPTPASNIQSFTAAAGVDIILQSRLAHRRRGQ